MFADTQRIDDLNTLRNYVLRQLCEQNELELNAFQMTERILVRRGQPCGIYFCLHGPRSVKFTAIWEIEHNSLLFYGCSGERLQKMKLVPAPALASALS